MIDNFHGRYSFLSNFYPHEIIWKGIRYPTNEHAYVAAKILYASKALTYFCRYSISKIDTPGKAKRAGRKITLRRDWEQVKVSIMRELLRLKFESPTMKALLLLTDDEELVEGNTWGDTTWGVCNGRGLNILGKLLMELRTELRNESGEQI